MSAVGSDQNEALLLQSLQAASQVWTTFDWSSKSKQWEFQANQNREAREASLGARKQLAETTKQFKRCVKSVEQAGTALASSNSSENASATVSAIESLAKQCRLTVKAYQEEIDNLTRRCKASESAFGTLHQSLIEVPDPAAVLATSLEHAYTQKQQIGQLLRTVDDVNKEMANVEKNARSKVEKISSSGLGKEEKEELIRLRREVAEYEVEFRSLKNQDITIRKLEARIVELQEAGEEELKEQLEKAKQELAETEGRRATEALEREAAMERRVQTLELQLKAELAGKAATQAHLLEANEGAGEREAAWEAQRKILVDDAERLRESLHQATRERDELRLKVAATEGGGTGRSASAPQSGGIAMADLLQERSAYEAELSELSHTANALREELRHKEEAIADERQTLQATISALETEQSKLNSNLASLEAQLAAAPSQSLVDSMKHELRVLKRLEYNADDLEVGERDPEMTGKNEEKDLESVLVAKLRRVESELVKERNEKVDAKMECEELRKAVADAEKAKKESERLIASLEADLDKAIAAPASPRKSRKSLEAGVSSTTDASSATLQSVLDPTAVPPPPLKEAVAQKSATEKAEDDHSVATIIMAQRDRLRARCEALEAERDSFKRELQAQVQAAESLKSDNTKLFEKMRYLQSFNSGSAPTSRGRGGGGAYSRGGAAVRDRDLDLEALEQRYEASVDPFRQFSRAERQRKLNEMSPMERTVFVVAKTMLGTKETRAFLFFYVVAMHVLVFLTTYHWSHSDSGCSMANNEHLSHLPPVVSKTAEEIVKDLSSGH